MITKVTKIYIAVISIVFAVGIFLPIMPALANTTTSPAQVKAQTVNITGTIRKLAVEGTCYQLAADDGKKYELIGKFPKIDGTRVQVRGTVATDVATICQVGQPFKVKTVRVIK
jgi:hypothetical protein